MKKQQFVFILLLLLPFTGCKSVVKDTVVEPVVQVEKRQTGVLFERKVNGNGDGMRLVMKQRTTNMWGKLKMVNPMVEGILLLLMERSM